RGCVVDAPRRRCRVQSAGAAVVMSIVERAADNLRQAGPTATPESVTDESAAPEQRLRDHVARAGQRHMATPQTSATPQSQAEPKRRLAVDFKKLLRAGLVPAAAAETMVAREYQRIKRPLLANAAGHVQVPGIADANRFMVAS